MDALLRVGFCLAHSDGAVRTLHLGSRLSYEKSTLWVKWDVTQAVGIVVAVLMRIFMFFTTLTLYFLNIAAQLSS